MNRASAGYVLVPEEMTSEMFEAAASFGGRGGYSYQRGCEARDMWPDLLTAAGAAPEGWVLVPREPTQAMLDANGDCPFPSGKQWLEDDARRTWDAMLAAAMGSANGQG